MEMTLYARYEPTRDANAGVKNQRDVQLYYDREATRPASRYPWHYTMSKPTRRNKWIVHNCARYRLEWLPDL